MGKAKNTMTIEDVRRECEVAHRQVRGLKDADVFQPCGSPVNAYAIRHYLSCMGVLFREIRRLKDQNDRLEEMNREANDEIVSRGVMLRERGCTDEQLRQWPGRETP